MNTSRLRRRFEAARDDERGSVVLVLFIIITASILVLAVTGIAVSQQVVAQRTLQRNDALEASEAGLDAALGELRAASSGGTGLVEDLPCTNTPANGFTLTGYLGGSSSGSYTTTVVYYQNVEPTVANLAAGDTEPVACFTGTTSSFPDEVPNYALIESVGKDPQTGPETVPTRTIEEIYAFHNTNQNIPGGIIPDYNYANDDLCLADNNTTPAVGDSLYAEKCQTSGTTDFTWLYNANFTIELSESESSTPLCIQGNQSTDTVTLQQCLSSSSSSFYLQQWGINDSGEYETVTTAGAPEGLCINEITNTAGSKLDLASCSGSFSDNQTWAPAPQVGPGDAGVATDQFVNYDEFGNCMDVTNQNVSSSYLIDYMCKQFPDGAKWTPELGTDPYDPDWNQRWQQISVTYQGNGEAYVELETHDLPHSDPGTLYCLYSPGNSNIGDTETHDEPNNPNWVVVKSCPALVGGEVPTGDQAYLWNVNSTSTYLVHDYWQDCLKADTYDQQEPASGSWFSTITVAKCDGDSAEEWNAPPSLSDAGVSNMFEPTEAGN